MVMESAPAYSMATSVTLRGLHLAILVRKELIPLCMVESKEVLRAGAAGLMGNKGAVSIILNIMGQSIQFVNCHLAAHQTESEARNETLMAISDNIIDPDFRTEAILCGDLNYRI